MTCWLCDLGSGCGEGTEVVWVSLWRGSVLYVEKFVSRIRVSYRFGIFLGISNFENSAYGIQPR